jgi:hypothetical protein
MPDIGVAHFTQYQAMRSEVVQFAVNTLDSLGHDALITCQIMEMLSAIVKKCYTMHEPRVFFEVVFSPFILMPLLEFTFEGGESTKQGSDFLRLLFHNLFICDPQDAVIDTVEVDFGFRILEVKEAEVFEPLEDLELNEEEKQKEPSKSDEVPAAESEKQDGVFKEDNDKMEELLENPNEMKRMKSIEKEERCLLQRRNRIFKHSALDEIIAQ